MTDNVADSIELAMTKLKIEDMEMTLLHAQQNFRNIMAHARCYICSEQIDDARWFLGDMGDTQEIVHADCFDQTSKKSPEEVIQQFLAPNSILEELPFEEIAPGERTEESGEFGFLLILPKNGRGKAYRVPQNILPVSTPENGKSDPDYQHSASREWTGEAEP